MTLISYLNRMMTIVFAWAHKETDLDELKQLTLDHHELFMQIYPGNPEQELNANEQQDENNVPEEENVDEQLDPEQEEEEEMRSHGFQDFLNSDSDGEDENPPAPAPNVGQGKRRKKQNKIIRMINRHHHTLHYCDIIRKFGPLILYWCARYEARHFFFKLAATVCHNYINVLKTLMEQLQMKLAAEKADPPSRIVMGKRGTKLVTVESTPHAEQLQCAGFKDFSKIYEVRHVTCDGVDFRPLLFVTIALRQVGKHPVFARIESIYVSENLDSVYLLIKEWKTERFSAKYCAYEIIPEAAAMPTIKKPSDLAMHRLMATWKRYDSNKLYLAPRTIA